MMAWLFFEIGQILHVLIQLDDTVRAKNNAATSRWEIFWDRKIRFAVRAFICSMIFGVFLSGELPTLLLAFKIEPWPSISALSAIMNSAAGIFIAGGGGYLFDSLFAYIPWLKSYVPSDVPTVTVVEQVKPIIGGIQNTKQTTEVTTTPTVPKAGG